VKSRSILLIILSLILLSSVALIPSEATTAGYQIYYRMAGDPKPGSEIVLQLAMSKAGGQVKPIGQAEFEVMVEGESEPITIKADETGVAEIRLKVPLHDRNTG